MIAVASRISFAEVADRGCRKHSRNSGDYFAVAVLPDNVKRARFCYRRPDAAPDHALEARRIKNRPGADYCLFSGNSHIFEAAYVRMSTDLRNYQENALKTRFRNCRNNALQNGRHIFIDKVQTALPDS